MDLDTRSLELLEAVAAHGTLTAAARHLHVSQPALSQRLTNLEARMGQALFDRQGRRMIPTAAGRRLLRSTSVALAELRAAARDLEDMRNGRDGVVRLTSQCSTNYQWLPEVIRAYGQRWPGVEVRIQSVPGDEPVAALLAGDIDVALLAKTDRGMEALRVRPLFEDTMVAVVPRSHSWAARSHVTGEDFDGVRLIVFESYDPARSPALPLPIPPGGQPAAVITTPLLTDLAIEMVAAGQGIAVLPRWITRPYLATHPVTTVALTGRPEIRTWSCATVRQPPPHIEAFAQAVHTHFDQHPDPVPGSPARR